MLGIPPAISPCGIRLIPVKPVAGIGIFGPPPNGVGGRSGPPQAFASRAQNGRRASQGSETYVCRLAQCPTTGSRMWDGLLAE